MSRKPTIVLLDATDGLGANAYYCLARSGKYRVGALVCGPLAVVPFAAGLSFCRSVSLEEAPDVNFPPSLRRQERGAVLLPVTAAAQRYLLRWQSELGEFVLPSLPQRESLATLDDKWDFAACVQRLGYATPRTHLWPEVASRFCADLDARRLDELGLRFPLVFKPRGRGGRAGFWHCNGPQDWAQRPSLGEDYLVQNFEGDEDWCVSALCHEGEVLDSVVHRRVSEIAFKDGSAFPLSHTIARSVAPLLDAALQSLAREFRWSGLLNLDARRESRTGQFFLLEANPRVYNSVFLHAALGVNLVEAWCDWILERQKPTRNSENITENGARQFGFRDSAQLLKRWRKLPLQRKPRRDELGLLRVGSDLIPGFLLAYSLATRWRHRKRLQRLARLRWRLR